MTVRRRPQRLPQNAHARPWSSPGATRRSRSRRTLTRAPRRLEDVYVAVAVAVVVVSRANVLSPATFAAPDVQFSRCAGVGLAEAAAGAAARAPAA